MAKAPYFSIMPKQRKIVETLFDLIDVDNDLEITWNEFLSFQAKAKATLKADWPFDIALIRQEFSDMDSDGSGTISKEEFLTVFLANFGHVSDLSTLESMLKKLGKSTTPNDSEIKKQMIAQKMVEFDQFDLDGNGSIDFSEFVKKNWSDSSTGGRSLKHLRREFKKHDSNSDGKISRDEYKAMLDKYYEI